jgi:putative DNA-invertase from lambdoid prophage Rac
MHINAAAIYARTSPDCPHSAENQIDLLRSIATEQGWAVTHVFSDHQTSGRKQRRHGEAALLNLIRSGQVQRVLIWDIDRIGRSLVDLLTLIESCRACGVALYIHEQKLDTDTCNGLTLFGVVEMFAHHVRQSRRDRIRSGQKAARASGVRFGRPSIPLAKVEKARQGLASGKGVREAARLAGISPASVSRIKAGALCTPS